MANLVAGDITPVQFSIPQTELLAGTSIELVSPVSGYIEDLLVVVQTAVTTGGAVTVKIGTTDVTGLSVTVANSATKGTTYSDKATSGTATRRVEKGGRIQIVPAAAFDTAGALAGTILINSADLSPALPAA